MSCVLARFLYPITTLCIYAVFGYIIKKLKKRQQKTQLRFYFLLNHIPLGSENSEIFQVLDVCVTLV